MDRRIVTMRSKASRTVGLIGLALGISACSSTSKPPAAAQTSTIAPIVAAAPTPPAPGVVAGPLGQALSEADRAVAIATQQEAVTSGARKSWRGERGAYGFVTPGTENGDCRDYAHKIFINGRPQEAKGRACRENGEWRVAS